MWYGRLCVTTRPLLSPCTGSQSLDTALCIEHVPSFGRTRLAGEVVGFSLHTHVFSSRIHMQILISIIKRSACISLIKIKKIRFYNSHGLKIHFYIYHLKSCVHRICKEPLIQILSLSLIIIAQFDDCRCVLSLCLCVIYVCFTYAMLKTLKIFIFENL